MDDAEQVAAYFEAGNAAGIMSSSYLFNSARISQVIAGCTRVLDLGCGPATQLAQVAELNPDIQFQGVDLSDEMLTRARAHVETMGLTNVEFVQGDVTDLSAWENDAVDGVISTMALHHLPTGAMLRDCFSEVNRVLSPGGAVYIVDFGRLKRLKSVLFFAYLNRKHQPHLFSLDYERSLRAAFSTDFFQETAKQTLPDTVSYITTFGIPILQLLKTEDRALSPEVRDAIRAKRRAIVPKYRRELDDQRFFFWLSGLRNDPF